MITAIIFDFDGVLVDSVSVHASALVKVLKPFVNLSEEYFRDFAGRSTRDILNIVKKKYNIPEDVGRLKKEKNLLFSKSLDKIKLCDGVVGVLEGLKNKGFKMAVATSGSAKTATMLLTKFHINDYLPVVVGVEMVKKVKPDPELFTKTAKLLGVKSNEVIVVEDAPLGVEAAKTAGMRCIAITNTVSKDKLAKADKVIGNISELGELI